MTLAHFSDTHLGFRAYGRTTSTGLNLREVDIMVTFDQALKAMAERDPDVVIHAGDLFHVVRPSNATIVRAYRLIDDFQRRRNHRPFVIIGGNHDSPRTSDSGNILNLFRGIPGVIVATAEAEFIENPGLSELGVEVLAVPSNALERRENLDLHPSGEAPYSVLVLHGMTTQALPDHGDLDVNDTHPDRWTYVALGDYHVHQCYGRNACYAGSTDFTSTNIWEEIAQPKGWIWFDTEKAYLEHVPLTTRTVLDLAPIDAMGLDGQGIVDALQRTVTWTETDLPIVRQRVRNVHPEVRSRLPQPVLREIQRTCLHYRLVLEAPHRSESSGSVAGAAQSLEQAWLEHAAAIEVPGGISRDAMRALGVELLKEVAEAASDPATA